MAEGYYDLVTGEPIDVPQANENLRNLDAASALQFGYRVLEGLTVSESGDFEVTITAGKAYVRRDITFEDDMVFSSGITPSSTLYLWLGDETDQVDDGFGNLIDIPAAATFFWSATPANPGQPGARLAKIVTDGSGITSVDNSFKHWALRWKDDSTLVVGDPAAPDLEIDVANHRIGIGKTAPAYMLDLSQTADNGVARIDQLMFALVASAPALLAGHMSLYFRGADLYLKDPAGDEIKVVDATLNEVAGLSTKITNGGNTPSITADVIANRPAFGTAGRIFYAMDTKRWYRDTGAAWVLVGAAKAEDLETAETNTSRYLRPNGSLGTQFVQPSLSHFPKETIVVMGGTVTLNANDDAS